MGRIANQPKISDLIAAGQLAARAAAPTLPGLPAIPSTDPGHAVNFRGPIADDQWDRVDAQRQWTNKTIPQQRITPPQPAQSAQGGSAILSQVAPVSAAASAAGLAAGQALAGVSALRATSFQGAWGSMVNYSQGASVDYLGLIYVSLVSGNLGNTPSSSPAWAATGNTSAFLGNWNSATNYVVGNQVIDVAGGGGYFICLANNVNRQPSSFPADWQLVTAGNLNSYEGNYSGSTAYAVGDLVSFQGALWVSVASGTGNTPSLTSSFWSLLGSNSLFTGPWSSSTPYPQNSFASQSGNIYQALTANTNVNPSTNPATWQLSGPATLDNLVDGAAFEKVLSSMVNLCPDSDIVNPTVYWPTGSLNYETALPAPPGCPAFFLQGTGSPSGFISKASRPTAVVPGATYTLSGTILASAVTSGSPAWGVFDPTLSTGYALANQTAGVDGRVSVTFTVPMGVTSVVVVAGSGNCTISALGACFWYQPQLVAGSNQGAYISSSADYLSGTVLIDFASASHASKNLGSIPDGTSTFGQTASGLSYSCLSNPLKGHDSGASTEIDISAFTLRTSSKGDLSISSGSILSLAYSTGYFIYFDDSVLAGGSETFHATTSKGTALQGSGRFFIGSCTTPAAGQPDTLGDNNGGTGVQTGQTLIVLSTAQSPNGTAGYGNLTPVSANTTISNVGAATEQWLSYIPQSSGIPSAITISVTSSVTITGAGTGNAILSYSTDGGSTFTTIYNVSATRASQTDMVNVTLPATVSKIVIQAQNSHTAGAGSSAHVLSNIQVQVQI